MMDRRWMKLKTTGSNSTHLQTKAQFDWPYKVTVPLSAGQAVSNCTPPRHGHDKDRRRIGAANSRKLNLLYGGGDPKLHWILCTILLLGCFTCSLAESGSDDNVLLPDTTLPITTTLYSPKFPEFSPRQCLESVDSVDQFVFICSEHPDLFPLLKYAESVAKTICEEEFKDELWNCTGFSLLKEPVITSGDNVFKESAYIYSLSLAVITHTVAKGCATNSVYNCTCGPSTPSSSMVCPQSIEFGLDIAEKFLNKRYGQRGTQLKHELAQHNFEATEHIIRPILNSAKKECHCHGISGSCTFQTCYSVLPEFSELAEKIKQAYDESCRVISNGRSQNEWIPQCNWDITKKGLIYRDTWDWCIFDPSIGSLGTIGRECDPSYSCTKLCTHCRLNYKEKTVELVTTCNCKFHFCCEIKCEECTERRTYYTCIS